MHQTVTLVTAFLFGLLSFASPCVLPIVPGYLSFISGVNLSQLKNEGSPAGLTRRVTITSLVFVLGFSTVFVALGAGATYVGYYLHTYKRALGTIGGVLIVLLGLHTAGILPIKWLLYEKKAEVRERPLGLLGAYVVGLAFAFGWTPCIGPILAAILVYASQEATVGRGILLLAVYSAGLGVPFVLSALAINSFLATSSRIKAHMRALEYVAGALLVGVGLLLVTNRLDMLARYFTRLFPSLATIG